jgi:hypothetical protein
VQKTLSARKNPSSVCIAQSPLQVKTVYSFTPEATPERNPIVVISAQKGLSPQVTCGIIG